jgi:hypothetical protein
MISPLQLATLGLVALCTDYAQAVPTASPSGAALAPRNGCFSQGASYCNLVLGGQTFKDSKLHIFISSSYTTQNSTKMFQTPRSIGLKRLSTTTLVTKSAIRSLQFERVRIILPLSRLQTHGGNVASMIPELNLNIANDSSDYRGRDYISTEVDCGAQEAA